MPYELSMDAVWVQYGCSMGRKQNHAMELTRFNPSRDLSNPSRDLLQVEVGMQSDVPDAFA